MNRLLQKLVWTLIIFCSAQTLYAQGQLWGMTPSGGNSAAGVVFKMNADGTGYSKQMDFVSPHPGATPDQGKLFLDSNGKFYGTTMYGGQYNGGVFFEWDPTTDAYSVKAHFGGLVNGKEPNGNLVKASNGKIYGTTLGGGTYGAGIIFEFDPTSGVTSKKFEFDGSSAKGGNPALYGNSLTAASNGKLYGSTWGGGAYNAGIIFEYDPNSNTLVKKFDFTPASNNNSPQAWGLTLASNSKFYALTTLGGANDLGVLFEFDPVTGTYTKKLDLDGANYGSRGGNLMLASDGKLYGMTTRGGVNDQGILFDYVPSSNTLSKWYDFNSTSGGMPYGSLTQVINGKMYGTTSGPSMLFEYDPGSHTLTKKLDMGNFCRSSLALLSNGKLYGMDGQSHNIGVKGAVFEYDPSTNSFVNRFYFGDSPNGGFPLGGLTQATNGKYYGMTSAGGTYGRGTLFEYDFTSNIYTKKFDFDWASSGGDPDRNLTLAENGKLYGVINSGGPGYGGTLFEYDPVNSAFSKKIDFDFSTKGGYPSGDLALASNGKLYGTTKQGGANNLGVIFEFDPFTGTFSKKFDFNNTTNGSHPVGSLVEVGNGKLFGIALDGGANSAGAIYQYDLTTNTYTKKYDFTGPNSGGNNYYGNLTLATNGKLYGTTSSSGQEGLIFEYDPGTGVFAQKFNYKNANWQSMGLFPFGKITLSSNGKFYGMTNSGGASGSGGTGIGIVYEFDPSTGAYSNKHDFDNVNGANLGPYFSEDRLGALTAQRSTQTLTFGSLPIKNYGDAPFDLGGVTSSGLPISYISSDPSIVTINGTMATILGTGTVTITARQQGDASYLLATPVTQTLTIRVNQTITFGSLSTKTYGDGSFTLSASSSSGLPVSFSSSDLNVVKITGNTATIVGAGSVTITASQAGDATYGPAVPVQQPLTVNKVVLTASAANKSKIYGDANPTLTFTYSGFVGTDNGSVIDTPPSISTTASLASGVGTYPITLLGGLDNSYSFNFVSGSLTITPASLTATAAPKTKLYGDVIPTLTINYSGFKGTDNSSVITQPTASTSASQTSPVGSYPITLTGGASTNYTLTLVNGTLTINQAALTVTADPKSKAYGDLNPALTFTYSGFKGSDNASVIDTPPSISTNASQMSPVGAYTISLSGGADNNYTLALVNGTLTVGKTSLTVTANNQTKIYGDVNPFLTFTYSGFKGTDNASVIDTPPSISTSATQTSGVGTYAISLSGGLDDNYSFNLVNGTLTVNKAILTATADDKSKKYLDPVPSLTISYSGFKGSDGMSVITTLPSVATAAVQSSPAGTYPITLSGGQTNNNYSLSLINGTLTINKADQTITFNALPTKNYGDAPFTLIATSSSGLPVTFASATTTVATIVGSTLTITGAGTSVITASQAGDSNYNPAPDVPQTLTVLLPKPTNPSSYVFLINEYATQVDLVTIPGNGNARLVVVKKDGPIDFVPTDNAFYTVGQTVGTNNNNFIGLILTGGASSGTIKNLQPGGTYYFDVYEFNQSNAYSSYLTTATATGGQITMPLATVQVITPINNSVNQNAPTLSVTTNTVPGATTYTVELYTNSFFTGTPIVKSGATVTQSFTGLAYSTQYFARAKTNLSTEYGPGTTFIMEPAEADAFLSAPAPGSTGNLVNLTVTSNAVNGATTYYIDLSTTSDFSSNVISKSGSTASLGFNGLSFSTTYYVRVKTNLSPNYGVTKSFTTADPVSLTYVTAPANAATAQATSLTVTTNTLTGATSYTIQLSPDQTFATGVVQKVSSTPSTTFSGLYYNTKYYSRVTSDLTPGQWGAIKNFTTRDHIITAPANNATNVNYSITLAAAAISGATTYTIEVNTSSTFTGGTSIVKTGAASQAFTLAYNTQYYVRVTCNLASGWGSTVTFTTGDPLSLAYVNTPANNATAQATSLNVTCNTLAGATSYTIQLSPDPTFATGVVAKTSSSPTASFSGLYYNTKYYARVTSTLTPGQWGTITNFTTRDHVLASGPANNATNVNYYLTLTAATIAGATVYSIEANTAPDFTGTSIVHSGAASQTFALAYNTQYYVRVTCNLASGWGSSTTFTTGDPVSLAYVTSPTNGGSSNYTTQNVTANSLYGATSYTIELNTSSDFSGTAIVASGSTNVVTFNGLTPATTYYTRVKTDLSANWGSTVTNFTTVATGGRVANDPAPVQSAEVTPFEARVIGNPFHERLKLLITHPEQTEAFIRVIDITGNSAMELKGQTNTILEIENQLVAGVYILQIQAGSQIQSVRVMKIE